MFFFFAGGVNQQVSRMLKSGAGRCISCGSSADLVDYEKVLKVFFVPVWRWPAKDPALYCNNCVLLFPPSLPKSATTDSLSPSYAVSDVSKCRFCDRVVESDFSFCPYCGSTL